MPGDWQWLLVLVGCCTGLAACAGGSWRILLVPARQSAVWALPPQGLGMNGCCRLVEQCNARDEVWVPSNHHVAVFARAGVQASKLTVMPESLDTNHFDPATVQPLSLTQ